MLSISKLSNGMRLVTDTDANSDTVSLGVWVSVGARYETPEINGISHVLEHMAFKGTLKRSALQISEEVENVGGIINAYTGKEMTAYYVKVLKEDLALGLDIIADILQNSQMDAEELEKEKGVICQEINMQNDTPDEMVFDYLSETAFPNQALGRSITGTCDIVRSITSKQLLDYMHSQYIADRMIISASGNFDADAFKAMCESAFSGIGNHAVKEAEPAHYVGGDKRVDKANEQVNLILGFNGIAYTDKDYYATRLMSAILGGGMSSRLFQEIREKRGLVYTISSFNIPESDAGTFAIYAGTGEKEVSELMPVLCDEILKLKGTITETELTRAKNRLKARLLMNAEAISTHAEMNATNMIVHGRVVPKEEIIADIASIATTDLDKVADRIFTSRPTLASLGPIKHVMSYDEVCTRLGYKENVHS